MELINSLQANLFLIQVLGLKLNLTNIDRPELLSKEQATKEHFINFLAYEENKSYKTFLAFGVAGSIVATDPSLKPKITPAVEIKYTAEIFTKTLSLLLSDYSVNTIMYIAQQSGMLKKNVDNHTNTFLPFNITTEGLSGLIPQFKTTYPVEKLIEMKAYVNAVKNLQPKIFTSESETLLFVNFNLEFHVYNSSDPWDDPVKDLAVNATVSFGVQTKVKNGLLSVIVGNSNVVGVNVLVDNLKVEQEDLKKTLNYFGDNLVHNYKANLTDIDVSNLLEGKTGLKVKQLNIANNKEYHTISIDLDM